MSTLRYRVDSRKRTWPTLIRNFFLFLAFLTLVYVVSECVRAG